MQSKKTLILTLVIAFSVHYSHGHAQENRLPLLFALALLPDDNLKVGLHFPDVKNRLLLTFVTDPLFLVRDVLPELDSKVKTIATEIQQGDDQQRQIIETAKQRGSLMLSRFRDRLEEPGEESIEEESEAIDWWELKQEPEANHSDMPEVCFGDDILLKPDSRYCFSPDSGVEIMAYSRAACDEGSGSEDSGSSDENSDNRPDEREAESDVQCENTTLDPFRALIEFSQFCATLRQEMTNQEFISDSKLLTASEVDVTEADSANQRAKTAKLHECDHEGCNYGTYRKENLKKHKQNHLPTAQRDKVSHCDHEGCNYSSNQACNLKTHKQTHLPAEQRTKRPKVHKCDHEGCNYCSDQACNLKTHKQTHLPADQRVKKPKVHKCDHEGCNYSTDRSNNLKQHKQIHLPADQREKVSHCDHEGCNYSTEQPNNLKKHKQTHLPADQRPKRTKVYRCDHEGCNYSSYYLGTLKAHKQTHLPADQRIKKPKIHQCDHEGCNYRSNHLGTLKAHKQTHLPADQRSRKPKRKACDQPPSNEKRKKADND
ncbi:hypothetical protein [Endozoicomonas sp. 4G]|uniref:hypothetical protein n=1 Tax=Endozoicomonas sp. 4G TaxID=2872754 RepID=UPI00207898D1|nr:hypothetical protein [Endozoicomonas sp. 4G]